MSSLPLRYPPVLTRLQPAWRSSVEIQRSMSHGNRDGDGDGDEKGVACARMAHRSYRGKLSRVCLHRVPLVLDLLLQEFPKVVLLHEYTRPHRYDAQSGTTRQLIAALLDWAGQRQPAPAPVLCRATTLVPRDPAGGCCTLQTIAPLKQPTWKNSRTCGHPPCGKGRGYYRLAVDRSHRALLGLSNEVILLAGRHCPPAPLPLAHMVGHGHPSIQSPKNRAEEGRRDRSRCSTRRGDERCSGNGRECPPNGTHVFWPPRVDLATFGGCVLLDLGSRGGGRLPWA